MANLEEEQGWEIISQQLIEIGKNIVAVGSKLTVGERPVRGFVRLNDDIQAEMKNLNITGDELSEAISRRLKNRTD